MKYKQVTDRPNILVAGGARPHRQRANKMYYTYVLESVKDGDLYVGSTDDLRTRVAAHQAGRVSSTHYRRPLQLIYYEACLSKNVAVNREQYFKTGFGRRFLKNRLAGSRGGRVPKKG